LVFEVLAVLWMIAPARSWGVEAHAVPVGLIVTSTTEEADKVLSRLHAGEDFGALARQYSLDATASDGGYLGILDPDSLRVELRDALRGVKPGEVTGVVQIPAGYAILKILKEPQRADSAADRDRVVAEIKNVRLAPSDSGYGEFYDAIRNSLPVGSQLRAWQTDLKSVCATREQAPREGIEAMQKLIANEGAAMDPFRLGYSHYTLGQLFVGVKQPTCLALGRSAGNKLSPSGRFRGPCGGSCYQ
jgi:hypothetical protein